MITSRGQAKVMDFGLAQVVSQPALNESEVETKSLLTERGIVGTVPYMSPEQINGQPIDTRSDIFSFGAVLYEALTGERAFKGSSSITILAAVLEHDPKPIPSRIPDRVANTIVRCLRKDPSERYQTMTELKAALEELRGAPHSAVRVSSWLRRWGWAAITAILLLGGIVGLVLWQPWRTTKSGEPFQAEALTTLPGVERSPSLNPEGTHVTFGWAEPEKNQDIYVQLIGQDKPMRLTTDPRDDYEPVWSPDGKWICFFRSEPPAPTGLRSRELRIIPPLGGTERKLADIRSQDFYPHVEYLAWSQDSNSLVVTDSTGEGMPNALFVISLETGEKRQLTNPQSPVIADTSPAVSPDGRSLIFLRRTTWGSGELQLLQLGSGLTAAGEPRRLTDVSTRADFPAWMPDGNEIIFSSKGSLWRLNVTADDMPARIPYVGDDGFMPVLSRSSKGEVRLVYVRSSWDGNFWRIDTSAPGAPATSKPVPAISSTKGEYHCMFSPDGSRVAFTSTRTGDAEIWVSDPDGSNAVKLTSLHAQDSNCPYWSPDGQWITFSSNGEGEFDVYVVSATGGKPRRLTTHPSIDIAPKFSRDGRWIYFSSMRTGDYRVWKMPADGGDAIQVTPNHGFGGAVESPDGSNIYYHISSVQSPLWRLSRSGGQPIKVLDRIVWFNWWLFGNGLYYIDQLKEETRLQYLNFATGKSTIIATNLGPVSAGLTASQIGKAWCRGRGS
jgi:Tol biopolymer transport system component